ncbi:MAG: hypothetical protein K2O73_11115 [Lachnospiraceae bacterium]|nr:hypothetical protein [Lachnospiraceae bacterium]
MRKMKRLLAAALCCVCLLSMYQETMMAASPEDEIMPCWDQTNVVGIDMIFRNNVATCILSIVPKEGVTLITGYLQLYDVTDGKLIRSWAIKGTNTYYSKEETYPVTRGHKYTLTYKGTITGSKGTDEIEVTKTGTNN